MRSFFASSFAWMSGGISVVLSVGAVYVSAPLYKLALGIAALCSFFLASYTIWAAERRSAVRYAKYLAKPDLAIEICQCYQDGFGPIRLLLRLQVVNKSPARVTVSGAQLEIIDADRVVGFDYREKANFEAVFHVPLLSDPNRCERVTRQLVDLLDETEHEPLERGIHKNGDLIFLFEESNDLSDRARLRLTLTDGLGNKHYVEQNIEVKKRIWVG